MSKILVIGHSVLDKIYFNNTLTEKPGGIFHSVNTLVNIGEKDDEVFLITQFSNKTFKYFEDVYNKVNLQYSEVVTEIPTVTLTLYNDKERDEKYSKSISKIIIPRNIDYEMFDIIYVNMISGFDITPDDLKFIRSMSKCKIYFDLHTLSRGFDEFGNRIFRTVVNPQYWLENIDILQMNINEKRTISNSSDEDNDFRNLFAMGIENIIVTNGGNPVCLFGETFEHCVDAIRVKSKNFVGCGDTFGAAFCYEYSKNKSIISSLKFANFIAGISTTYSSPKDYIKLRKDVRTKFN